MGDLRLQHKAEPTKLLTLQHKPLQQISVPCIYAGWQDLCFAEAVPYGQSGLPYQRAKAEGREIALPSHLFKLPSFPQIKLHTFMKISANVIT